MVEVLVDLLFHLSFIKIYMPNVSRFFHKHNDTTFYLTMDVDFELISLHTFFTSIRFATCIYQFQKMRNALTNENRSRLLSPPLPNANKMKKTTTKKLLWKCTLQFINKNARTIRGFGSHTHI